MKSHIRQRTVCIVESLIAKIIGTKLFEYFLFHILVMSQERSNTIQSIDRLRSLGACLASFGLSESQLKQDQWVIWRSEMKRGGYFVDIGACYPIRLSNTHNLEANWGWTGLLIEPNPYLVPELKAQRTSKVLNLAVGQSPSIELSIAINPEFSSARSKEEGLHKLYAPTGEKVTVECKTLREIFEVHNVPKDFDYLSIDVEGSEMSVLESGDWKIWRPKFITVEHNFSEARNEINNFLKSVGYERDESISVFSWDDLYVRITNGN